MILYKIQFQKVSSSLERFWTVASEFRAAIQKRISSLKWAPLLVLSSKCTCVFAVAYFAIKHNIKVESQSRWVLFRLAMASLLRDLSEAASPCSLHLSTQNSCQIKANGTFCFTFTANNDCFCCWLVSILTRTEAFSLFSYFHIRLHKSSDYKVPNMSSRINWKSSDS